MKKNLKPIPAGNKGLPKLPKTVRNNMGFLKAGGMVKDKRSKFMGGGIAYAGGGKAMKREMYSEGTIVKKMGPERLSKIKDTTSKKRGVKG